MGNSSAFEHGKTVSARFVAIMLSLLRSVTLSQCSARAIDVSSCG
jgi:hypothetical protein